MKEGDLSYFFPPPFAADNHKMDIVFVIAFEICFDLVEATSDESSVLNRHIPLFSSAPSPLRARPRRRPLQFVVLATFNSIGLRWHCSNFDDARSPHESGSKAVN